MRSVRALLCGVVAGVFAGAASGSTIATFSDPTSGQPVPTPMFTFDGMSLTGGWSGTGLTLHTIAGSFSDVTFSISPLGATPIFGGIFGLTGGSVTFLNSASLEILRITFASGQLTTPAGFGASDFIGQDVTFSGPVLDGFAVVQNETFAFSFANPRGTPLSYTATASFTSSADVEVPAPGAAGLLALAGLAAARRRR